MTDKLQKLLTVSRGDAWPVKGWQSLDRMFAPLTRKKRGVEFRAVHLPRTKELSREKSAELSSAGLDIQLAGDFVSALGIASYLSSSSELLRKRMMTVADRRQSSEARFVEFCAEQLALESYLLEVFQLFSLGAHKPELFAASRKAAQSAAEKFSGLLLFLVSEKEILSVDESQVLLQSVGGLLHLSGENPEAHTGAQVCDLIVQAIGVQ